MGAVVGVGVRDVKGSDLVYQPVRLSSPTYFVPMVGEGVRDVYERDFRL